MVTKDISNIVLCRSKEVEVLSNLLGKPDDAPPPSIFISGHHSCGKSITVKEVLKHLNVQHCIISCVEVYTTSLLLDPILLAFTGSKNEDNEEEELLIKPRCEDMLDFVQQLNHKALEDQNFLNQKLVIVLDDAECLRDLAPNLLSAFLRLQKLTLLKRICVILVSSLSWEKFQPPRGLFCPHQIYFPQYTQNELQTILALDCPSKYPKDFYENYVHLFLSVFWRSCRDVRELRYKARVNFSKYCEPIESGDADIRDSKLLWQYITPHFKTSLKTIYMRTEMSQAQSADVAAEADSTEHTQALSASAKFALSFELPVFAKYLLIAAYIASYNSPKEDKKMFVKLSGRKKKQVEHKSKNSVAKMSFQIIGPRVFDLARLLAIFYAILEKKPRLSVNLLTEISSLVELQLLHRVGDDALENPKYKCAVGLDFTIIIAKTLNISVTKYLADYK